MERGTLSFIKDGNDQTVCDMLLLQWELDTVFFAPVGDVLLDAGAYVVVLLYSLPLVCHVQARAFRCASPRVYHLAPAHKVGMVWQISRKFVGTAAALRALYPERALWPVGKASVADRGNAAVSSLKLAREVIREARSYWRAWVGRGMLPYEARSGVTVWIRPLAEACARASGQSIDTAANAGFIPHVVRLRPGALLDAYGESLLLTSTTRMKATLPRL